MALTKLVIPPNQASYATKDGKEVISAKLDGGASRFRRDILEAASSINVVWSVGPDEYQYLRAFYKSVTVRGSLPFLIDLYMDLPTLTEHEAYFVPKSFALTGQRGKEFTVSAQLEAIPLEADDDLNIGLVALYNAYGSFAAAEAVLDRLAIFANEDLPTYLGFGSEMLFLFDSGTGLDPVISGSDIPSTVWEGPSGQLSYTGTPNPALNEAGEWEVTMDDFADVKSIVANDDSVVSILFNDKLVNFETLDLSDNPNLNVDLIVNEIYKYRDILPSMTVDMSGTCPPVSSESQTKIDTLVSTYGHVWNNNNFVVDDDVVFIARMDGVGSVFVDSALGGNAPHSITAYGDAQQVTFVNDPWGGNLPVGDFDGDNDYIEIPDDPNFSYSNDSFTFDTWVRFDPVPSGLYNFYWQGVGATPPVITWFFDGTIDRLVFANQFAPGANYRIEIFCDWSPATGTWYHLRLVRNGNTWYMFINGVSQSLTLDQGSYSATLDDIGEPIQFGIREASIFDHDGQMSNFRVTLRALNTSSASFTPPAGPFSPYLP